MHTLMRGANKREVQPERRDHAGVKVEVDVEVE